MKKVLIIGPSGQLGADLVRVFRKKDGYDVVAAGRPEIDLCDRHSVFNAVSNHAPDIVINAAGQTDVEGCEYDASHAMLLNAEGAGCVADACAEAGSVCVYVSSDYVFDGKKGRPYTETDECGPLNAYGVSKLEGERLVRGGSERHFIIRTSSLFGPGVLLKRGRNFVETMIMLAEGGRRIRVVDDQVMSPTYTRDLAPKIAELLEEGDYGTYHITNSGECSWYRFGLAVFDAAGLSPEVIPVTSEEYGARAKRPKYSVLDNQKLESRGIKGLRRWEEALKDYVSLRHGYPRFPGTPRPGS